MNKIKVAFIKFGGLSAGGTERWLQMMAANLPKNQYVVDYYYCDAAPYLGSDYKHADTDKNRLEYMLNHEINLIKFNVGYKDITSPYHDWIKTDFWQKFDSSRYDLVQTGRAGYKEYPYHLIGLPVIEFVALSGDIDFSPNIIYSIHLSDWQRKRWLSLGGAENKSCVIPIPVEPPVTKGNLRKQLGIPNSAIVAGFHQRPDNNIASDIPLQAFSELKNPLWHFIIMGGGEKYRQQASRLKLSNVHFIDACSNAEMISSFLNTLNIFAHGRADGETFGTVFAEAMIHDLPCLSHKTGIADAHQETMGSGGIFADDLVDYRDKLRSLFADEALRLKLARNGKERAEKLYSLNSAVNSLSHIYQEIIEKLSLLPSKEVYNACQISAREINRAKRLKIIDYFKILIYNKYFFRIFRAIRRTFR